MIRRLSGWYHHGNAPMSPAEQIVSELTRVTPARKERTRKRRASVDACTRDTPREIRLGVYENLVRCCYTALEKKKRRKTRKTRRKKNPTNRRHQDISVRGFNTGRLFLIALSVIKIQIHKRCASCCYFLYSHSFT